jgi:hypothetical protein
MQEYLIIFLFTDKLISRGKKRNRKNISDNFSPPDSVKIKAQIRVT